MISHGDLTVVGLSLVSGLYTVSASGELVPVTGIGCVRQGAVSEVAAAVRVDGPMQLYMVKSVSVLADTPCKLSGTVVPVGSEVHLAQIDIKDKSPSALQAGTFATVMSSQEDGVWEADAPEGHGGFIAAWIKLPVSTMADAASASLSIKAEQDKPDPPVDPPEHGDYLIALAFAATPDIQDNNTTFTFCATLQGPEDLADIEVYATDSGEDDGETLLPIRAQADGPGKWSVDGGWDKSDDPYYNFEVRGYTADPQGVMTITVDVYEARCLSGDTLITLADGTVRRLDELAVGDIVLGGDGQPARVLRLGRGAWNDQHILYHFDDGTTIDEIHEHRFYNIDQGGFWQKLKNWRIGDRARRQDGGETVLVAVERIGEPAEMFGLWVERGSYWAGGLLSGDASANQALLAEATVEQAAEMAASLGEQAVLKLFGIEGVLP